MIRWSLLLQEFDIEIRDKKGMQNLVANHLSHLENNDIEALSEENINDNFPNEKIYSIDVSYFNVPWYADIANYLSVRVLSKQMAPAEEGILL